MEIILRDASSLARACGQAAQSIVESFNTDQEILFSAHVTNGENESEIAEVLRSQSAKTMRDLDDVFDLYRAQATIRALAFKANAQTVTDLSVSDLIAEKETFLTPAEKTLKDTYLGQETYPGRRSHNAKHDAADVAAHLKGIVRRMQTVTNDLVSDTVRVPKLSDADTKVLEDRLAELRRRIRTVSREMGHGNYAVSLVLPEHVVVVLRKHKII